MAPIHFFITHQELPEPVKPGVANLDHSAPCLETGVLVHFCNLFAARPDVRDIAPPLDLASGGLAHITSIQAEVLRGRIFAGTLDDNAVQGGIDYLAGTGDIALARQLFMATDKQHLNQAQILQPIPNLVFDTVIPTDCSVAGAPGL